MMLRKEVPEAHITVVNQTKSYKRYWIEETRAVRMKLSRLRNPGQQTGYRHK